jgi:hypothetical protein
LLRQPEIVDRSLEFGGGGFRVLHGEMGEAGVTLRPALHLDRETIVRLTGEPHGNTRVGLDLHARTGQGQNREVTPASSMAASRWSPKSDSNAPIRS